jgi:hypothetical protein
MLWLLTIPGVGRGQGHPEAFEGQGPPGCPIDDDALLPILLEVRYFLSPYYLPENAFRSGTPLLYRAIPVWSVRVTPIVEQLMKNNQETRWSVVSLPHYRTSILMLVTQGCPKMLVRTDSATGSRTRGIGMCLATGTGARPFHCGSATTWRR